MEELREIRRVSGAGGEGGERTTGSDLFGGHSQAGGLSPAAVEELGRAVRAAPATEGAGQVRVDRASVRIAAEREERGEGGGREDPEEEDVMRWLHDLVRGASGQGGAARGEAGGRGNMTAVREEYQPLQGALAKEDTRDALVELLSGTTTEGGPSSSTAKGIRLKQKADARFATEGDQIFDEYRQNCKTRLKVKAGESWRPLDLKAKGLLDFKGYKTLERWCTVTEAIGEAIVEEKWKQVKALQ